MNTISHCPACGERTAIRTVVGELSSLYECPCGNAFERDHPTDQTKLLFPPLRENREQRMQRILAGSLGRVVRPASELQFDYAKATKAAREAR